jgi:hypothetical protein
VQKACLAKKGVCSPLFTITRSALKNKSEIGMLKDKNYDQDKIGAQCMK